MSPHSLRLVALLAIVGLVQGPAAGAVPVDFTPPSLHRPTLFPAQALAGAGYPFFNFLLGRPHRVRALKLLICVGLSDMKKTGGVETYVQVLNRALLENEDLMIHAFYIVKENPRRIVDPGSAGRIVYHELASDARLPWIVRTFHLGWQLVRTARDLLRQNAAAGGDAVIHVHGPSVIGFLSGASWLAVRYGIPRVITLHGGFFVIGKGLATALTEKYAVMLFSLGAWISAVTPEILAPFPGRHSVIGTGINTRQWRRGASDPAREAAFKDALGLKKGVPILFYPARIEPFKNQKALIALAARLRARHLECQFVIMGEPQDPAYLAEITHVMREAGVSDMFVLLPPGPPEAVRRMFEVTYALVMTSLAEGRPMVILEAAAMQVPTIAYDVGGLRHIVQNGVTGQLVPMSFDALEAKTAELLEHPEWREAMGEKARAFVVQEAALEGANGLAERQMRYYRLALAGPAALLSHALVTAVASALGLLVLASGMALSFLQKALAAVAGLNPLIRQQA